MGIGSGSVCTTRLKTGVGYPQFSCIKDTKINIPEGCYIMSDGGMQQIGDFSKAYGIGADFVMSGGMFAGHDECSGCIVEENGIRYKVFYGMSSANAMNKYYEHYKLKEIKKKDETKNNHKFIYISIIIILIIMLIILYFKK